MKARRGIDKIDDGKTLRSAGLRGVDSTQC